MIAAGVFVNQEIRSEPVRNEGEAAASSNDAETPFRILQFRPWRAYPATYTLILLSVIMFAGMVAFDIDLRSPPPNETPFWGLAMSPFILRGEWGRFFASAFVHFGFYHLCLNMVGLWLFSRLLERELGSLGLLTVYSSSHVATTAVRFGLWPYAAAAGSSFAVTGVIGALLALFILRPPAISRATRNGLMGLIVLSVASYFFPFPPRPQSFTHLFAMLVGFASVVFITRRAVLRPPVRGRIRELTVLAVSMIPALFLLLVTPDPVKLWNEAADAREQEDYGTALKNISAYIKLVPDHGDAHYWRGMVNVALGNEEDAISDFTHTVMLDPWDIYALNERGYVHLDLENVDDAISDFNRAILIEPESTDALNGRGLSHLENKDYEWAIANFDRAIELDPDEPWYIRNRGHVRFEMGDFDVAILDWRKASELAEYPEDKAGALENIGFIHLKREAWAEALALTEEVEAIHPELPRNNFIRAISAHRLGQTETARSAHRIWFRYRTAEDVPDIKELISEDLWPYMEAIPE